MWVSFFLASATGLLILYGIGFFFFRAINIPKTIALVCAPVFSVSFLCCIGLVFSFLEIKIDRTSLLAILLFSLLLFAVINILRQKISKKTIDSVKKNDPFNQWIYIFLYLLVGLVIVGFFYVKSLDGPSSFIQTYDNVFHYNVIESFISSGTWSIFKVDDYLGMPDSTFDPFPGTSFYPAGWHIVAATIGIISNIPATEAANATNFIFLFAVFPLNIFFLLKTLFPSKQHVVFFGSFASLAVVAFPWSLHSFWPLFPNATSLCLLPTVLASFILFFSGKKAFNGGSKLGPLVIFLIGTFSLFAVQPNTIFSAIVFLTPFSMWQIATTIKNECTSCKKNFLYFILPVLFFVAVAAVWYVLFSSPLFRATVNYYWPPLMTAQQAIISIVTMSFLNSGPSYVIAILLLLGILYILLRKRKYSWLVASFFIGTVFFFISATQGNTFIKHFLTGFWYTDPYRLGALCGLFSIPLVCLGLSAIVSLVKKLLSRKTVTQTTTNILSATLAIAFVLIAYWPFIEDTPFYDLRLTLIAQNDASFSYLNTEEISFVQEVKETVPDGDLIINQPFDGSLFAYASDELNVYYRSISGYGETKESAESTIIRNGLCDLNEDQRVKEAINKIGAQYVLILDLGENNIDPTYPTYHKEQWQGLSNINDETPGLETVLQKDNMRLYRIVV